MSEETKSAHAFTEEVCKGNAHAKVFCNLFYHYCHLIDDVLDSREDGRPTMSSEQILESYATAALLYNCSFFVGHRDVLFPVILTVTNIYCDSVAWERSPDAHKRKIADVLRCCGDEVMLMVALICGGWAHMRSLSPRIREKDFLLQHDDKGNPT